MKKIFITILAVIGAIIFVVFTIRLLSGEDDWICVDGKWTRHGHPNAPMPTGGCGEQETTENVITPEECQQKGGRVVNITGGEKCNPEEVEIGKIKVFISPNICCLPTVCTKKDTDYKLILSEAKQIAQQSDCVQEGQLKEESFCNQNTGTWWINMEIPDKPGCSPACVINVVSKEAEINWRCTGLIPKPQL